MPKIKQYAERYAGEDFWKEIHIRMLLVGVSTERELAAKIGVAPATLSKRKKNVPAFSVKELRGLVRELRPDPVIVLKMLGYTGKEISEALPES